MAISELDLRGAYEALEEGVRVPFPEPTDKAMLGGVALIGSISALDFESAADKLATDFAAMRTGKRVGASSCIAYGIDLTLDVQTELDNELVQAALTQNFGTIPKISVAAASHTALWEGIHDERWMGLLRYNGPLLFNDYVVRQDVSVYTLQAASRE